MASKDLIDQTGLSEDNYHELDAMQNQLVGEIVYLFERFYIFHRIVTGLPLKLIRRDRHRFIDNLILTLKEDILLKIWKMLIDPDGTTLPKFKTRVMQCHQSDRITDLRAKMRKLENPLKSGSKERFLKALRKSRLAHFDPHYRVADEIRDMQFGLEEIVDCLKYVIKLFDILSNSISTHQIHSLNLTYHKLCSDLIYGRTSWIEPNTTTDVDLFIVDYLDRHHPEVFHVPMEMLRELKTDRYGEFRDFDDEDFAKIERLRVLKTRTDAEKEQRLRWIQEKADYHRKRRSEKPND